MHRPAALVDSLMAAGMNHTLLMILASPALTARLFHAHHDLGMVRRQGFASPLCALDCSGPGNIDIPGLGGKRFNGGSGRAIGEMIVLDFYKTDLTALQ
jgi:hypothetical protein